MQRKTQSATFSVGPNYKWAIVLMLWVVSFFNYADRSAVTAIFPVLRKDLHFTTEELGLLGSSFLWVYAVSAPLAGFLGDRFSRKIVILGGLTFWSLVTFITPFAGTIGLFIFFRALTGLGEAAYYPAGTSLISDYHDQKTRSRALSIHQTAVFAGGIIGTTLAGFLAERFHWQYVFFSYGGAGIILALILWVFMKEPPKGLADRIVTQEKKVPISSIFRTPSALLLCFVFFGANFVTWALNTWVPTYIHDQYHLSLTGAAFAGTSSLQIASLLGVLSGGFLADVLYQRTILARFYILAGGLLVATPFVFLVGQTLSVTVLMLSLAGAGFFKGMFDGNIYAAMHQVVAPAARSTAVGVMTAVGFLGGGLAPFVIGLYASVLGLGPAMALTAFLYIIAGLPILLFRPLINRDSRKVIDAQNVAPGTEVFNGGHL